jgi:thiosulfate/3-mercaptopyruvate sulfurtransferase
VTGAGLPGPLVDDVWLAEHLDEVRVVDVRWYLDGRSGRDAYKAGHLPGAVWADTDRQLSAPASPEAGRHPLPTPRRFASAMSRLGIGDGDPVVAYDDASGSIAARLWWMLHALGHPAAVLDGGIQSWTGPLETRIARPERAAFTPRPWPEALFVDADGVDALRGAPRTLLVDARTAERFTGEDPSIDPRPGHVPGARSAPWGDNVDPATRRLLPPHELRRRYDALGAGDAVRIVAACGSGVTACHDLLALEVAGYAGLALYPGSWSQWASDPDRPAALGPA